MATLVGLLWLVQHHHHGGLLDVLLDVHVADHLPKLVLVDSHPLLFRVPGSGLIGEVHPRVHVLRLLGCHCPGSMRAAQDGLASAGRLQPGLVDSQARWQAVDQFWIVLEVSNPQYDVHTSSAHNLVGLQPVVPTAGCHSRGLDFHEGF